VTPCVHDVGLTHSRRRLVAALVVLALLAAQALGLAHRAVHGQAQKPGHGTPAAVAKGVLAPAAFEDARAPAHAAHVQPSAFDTHEPGGPECRLVDQAAHLDVVVAAATAAMPPRVPRPRPPAAEEEARAGSACAYLARGPPAMAGEGHQRLG